MRSINASASICKPGTGSKRAAGEAHLTDKLTDPRPAAEAGAETEFATQGETAIGEERNGSGEGYLNGKNPPPKKRVRAFGY
jgi:hypothetical protein